jgi:hypothetical protein
VFNKIIFRRLLMVDDFFTQTRCDRCGGPLTMRTMSWFNNDTICQVCAIEEGSIRKKLPENGKNYEGCGYVPKIEEMEKD